MPPEATCSRTSSATSAAEAASSETVGSSSSQSLRRTSRSRARPSRRRCPAEHCTTGRSAICSSPKRESAAATGARSAPRMPAHATRFALTVSAGFTASKWPAKASCSCNAPRSVESDRSPSRTSPAKIGNKPAITRSSVDLPDPFGPRIRAALPASIWKESPENTTRPPRRQESPSRTSLTEDASAIRLAKARQISHRHRADAELAARKIQGCRQAVAAPRQHGQDLDPLGHGIGGVLADQPGCDGKAHHAPPFARLDTDLTVRIAVLIHGEAAAGDKLHAAPFKA